MVRASGPQSAKGDTIVESQTPSGPKPPNPQQPPSKSDSAWISPRLREKLGEPDTEGPKKGGSPLIGILLAVLVIGGGVGLFITMRAGAAKEKAATEERARVAAAAAVAESIAAVAQADSTKAAADSAAALAASTPAGRAAAKAAAKAAAAAASKPAPVAAAKTTTTTTTTSKPSAPAAASAPGVPKVVEKGPFGLDVGTFIVEDRANSEQARLAEATGLVGKVVTRNEDGGDVYHVVLGSFATRAAAEKKAEALVAKGQVNQARPVSLAP
jgi:cytoskeletal protein RodZ